MRHTIIITALLSTLVATGCQQKFRCNLGARRISISTTPSNARVYQVNPLSIHPDPSVFGATAAETFADKTYLGMTPITRQSVSVVTGFSGRTSPSRMQRMATLLDMVEVMIVKDGYGIWHGFLPTEKDAVTEHTIALEKAAD